MILAYLPVWKPVNLFNACLATSLDKLFINFKSLQNYAKSLEKTNKKGQMSS